MVIPSLGIRDSWKFILVWVVALCIVYISIEWPKKNHVKKLARKPKRANNQTTQFQPKPRKEELNLEEVTEPVHLKVNVEGEKTPTQVDSISVNTETEDETNI